MDSVTPRLFDIRTLYDWKVGIDISSDFRNIHLAFLKQSINFQVKYLATLLIVISAAAILPSCAAGMSLYFPHYSFHDFTSCHLCIVK